MIIRKTERYYQEGKKKWLKHGSHDKELCFEIVKRTTIWVLFIPICYWEKVVHTSLIK